MKWIAVCICIVACMAIVSATTCQRQEDCNVYNPPRCCVSLLIVTVSLKGVCLPMNREGARCSPEEAYCDYFGKYILSCPCQEGLECKPKGLSPSVTDPGRIFHSMRCQKAPPTTEPPTTTVAETEVNTGGRPEVTTGGEIMEPETATKGEEVVQPEVTTPEEEVVQPEVTTTEEEVVQPEVTTPEEEVVQPEVTTTEEEVVQPEVTTPEEEVSEPEITTIEEGVLEPEFTTVEEVLEPEVTTMENVREEIRPEDEETGENEVGEETGSNETGQTGEVLDETPDKIPEEVRQGPGGEPPRDDDCEDWEIPC